MKKKCGMVVSRKVIHHILDESKEADKKWLQKMRGENDQGIGKSMVVFPSWKIVACKAASGSEWNINLEVENQL